MHSDSMSSNRRQEMLMVHFQQLTSPIRRAFAILLSAILITATTFPVWVQGQVTGGSSDFDRVPSAWRLELVDTLGGAVTVLAVFQGYPYVQIGRRLARLDISDPSNIRIDGQTPIEFDADTILAQSGPHVFTYHDNRFEIVDVSTVSTPSKRGGLDIDGAVSRGTIAGSLLYLVSDLLVHVVDVSDPASPIEIARYAAPEPTGYPPHIPFEFPDVLPFGFAMQANEAMLLFTSAAGDTQ